MKTNQNKQINRGIISGWQKCFQTGALQKTHLSFYLNFDSWIHFRFKIMNTWLSLCELNLYLMRDV